MKRLLAVLAVVLLPTVSHATYNQAVVDRNELTPYGAARLVTLFTGDDGEPQIRRDYVVNASSTMASYRQWVRAVLDELNLMRVVGVLPGLQPGQVITPLNLTPPTPTAKQVWRRKVDTYTQMQASGFTGTLATDLSALKADIEATYQVGYLD